MSDKNIILIISSISMIIGFCIVGFNSNWYVPTGVFIMLFGNNIEQGLRFKKR